MEKGSRSTIRQKIDDREDLEIKKVAYSKLKYKKIILILLLIFFISTVISTIIYGVSYNEFTTVSENTIKVFEVTENKNQLVLINSSEIYEKITDISFNKENFKVIETINIAELSIDKGVLKSETINLNVRLKMLENDFKLNDIATNKSPVLIRVSYSYDNEKWDYIKSVLSYNDSTLTPLMGNYYDIAGRKGVINIATNHELSALPGEIKKVYWKLEVMFNKQKVQSSENNFKANFYLEYPNSKK